MFSLGVFLQPMSAAEGWSRTGISTAALLNFLCMGVGSFVWGALSDRLGTRAVVLLGGVLLGLGTVMASQAPTLGQFQVYFGLIVGFAAGSLYAPMTATTTRWFTRHRSLAVALVSAGLGLGSTTTAPLARWIITNYDWRMAMLVHRRSGVARHHSRRVARARAAGAGDRSLPEATAGADGRELTAAQALRTPQFAAIAFTYFACCAAHSGPIFHMVTHAIDHGVPAMAAATVLSVAGLASLSGKIICGLVADRVGAKRVLLAGLALQAIAVSLYLVTRELLHFYAVALMFGFAYGGVMPLYAILVREYFGARIMGTTFGAVGFASTLGMALGPRGRRLAVRRVRQLRLAVHRLVRDRPRGRGHRVHVPPAPLAAGRAAELRAWPTEQVSPTGGDPRVRSAGRQSPRGDQGGSNGSKKRSTREAVRGESSGGRGRARAAERRGLEKGDRGGALDGRRDRAPLGERLRAGRRHRHRDRVRAVAGQLHEGHARRDERQARAGARPLHQGGDDRAPQEGRGSGRRGGPWPDDDQLAKSGTVFTDAPPMTAEQLITGGLITHIDAHVGSIRKAVGN